MSEETKHKTEKQILTYLGKIVENYLKNAENNKSKTWEDKFKAIDFDDIAFNTYIDVFGKSPNQKYKTTMDNHDFLF